MLGIIDVQFFPLHSALGLRLPPDGISHRSYFSTLGDKEKARSKVQWGPCLGPR